MGADGRVWFSILGDGDAGLVEGEGLVVFDGQDFTRYLVDKRVHDLAIAPDGSVWTSTEEGLYVITPQAE